MAGERAMGWRCAQALTCRRWSSSCPPGCGLIMSKMGEKRAPIHPWLHDGFAGHTYRPANP
eukprot:8563398-Prorocentrum_lima.AAC.1